MKLSAHVHKLYMKEKFVVSYGAYDFREVVTVELDYQGVKGYGEATVISYYNKSVADFKRALEKIKPFVEALTEIDPIEFWNKMQLIIPDYPFIQGAIDCALHSIKAEIEGKTLYDHLGFSNQNLPITNYTISIGTPENMLAIAKKNPWPSYKVKVAERPNIDLLRNLANMHNSTLRLDANTAWPKEKAKEYIDLLLGLPIDFIEQPFKPKESDVLKEIKKNSPFLFVADESCQTKDDVEKCAENFDVVNIKLQKCGGITPALEMIKLADKLGLKKMLGCMTESSIGITNAAQLLGQIDFADLDGSLLINNDFADGLTIKDGHISLPKRKGAGIQLNNCFSGKKIV